MIYQTGTVTTTAGQTKIKGTGTRWKDNLVGISEGCPISIFINNVVYFNNVLSVNSDTEINLTYPVPVAAAAAKYQIATFVLDSMSDGVRKMLANQQYIQYFLRNMDTWLTQDGIVEIKTPTGETVRLESIIALKKLIDGKLSIGAFGIGAGPLTTQKPISVTDANSIDVNGIYAAQGGNATNFASNYAPIFVMTRGGQSDGTGTIEQQQNIDGKIFTRSRVLMKWTDWITPVYPGDYGVGGYGARIPNNDYNKITKSGIYGGIGGDSGTNFPPGTSTGSPRYGAVISAMRNSNEGFVLVGHNYELMFRSIESGNWKDYISVYTTRNTTKDSNGNLKAASPVIKVFTDHIDPNEEAEGVTLKKLHTGIYQLHGVLGLHSDASWGGVHGGITIPCGINQLPLVYALYDVLEKGKPHPFDGRIVEPDENGDIVLYTTYRKHDLPQNIQYERFKLYPEFLKEVDGEMVELTPGEPCDIPNGHWIDVRVNMPSNSIYNQKLAEAERLAKIEAERVAQEEAEQPESEEI